MKKLYTLLTLALLFVGTQSALADETTTTTSTTVVSDEANLNNTHVYYLQGPRGFLTAASGATALSVTEERNGTTYSNGLNDASTIDTNTGKAASYQFLILKSGLGNYYIYSVGASNFLGVGDHYAASSSVENYLTKITDYKSASVFTIDADQFSGQTNYKTSIRLNSTWYLEISSWTAKYQALSNDLGSYWAIMDAGDISSDETLSAAATTALYNIDKQEAATCLKFSVVGTQAITDEQRTSLQTAYDSEATGKESALHTALESIANASKTVELSTSAYYQLYEYRSDVDDGFDNHYISSVNAKHSTDGTSISTSTLQRVNETSATSYPIATLWQFEESSGTYAIKNANGGYISSLTAGTNVTLTNTAAYFTLSTFAHGPNQFMLKNNSLLLAGLTASTANVGGSTSADSYGTDYGTYWMFVPVTSVTLKIGSTGWASICYPFAVTKPDGLTVYKVSATSDNYVTLEEYTGNVIPANTGFFVTGTASTSYTMTISSTTPDAVTSGLEGTTLQRTGFTTGSEYYALAASNGTAVLKLNAANVDVPANKAYLDNSSTNPTRELSLNIGGEATGINSIATPSNDSETFYDLQGRRVLYPVHGIFVKSNGQKVYIK